MQGIPQPEAVLLKDRLVEPKFFPHQLNLLWGRAVVAVAPPAPQPRIYRGQVGVKEGQDGDAEQDNNRAGQAGPIVSLLIPPL